MRFSETQYIRSPLAWLLAAFVLVACGMGLYKAVHISMLTGLILGTICTIGISIFLVIMPLSIKTVVDETEMRITVYPNSFATFSIGLHQISSLQVVTTEHLRDQINQAQGNASNSLMFVVGGKFVLRIVSTTGKEILVGTRKPRELFRALCR
jgi:uncharacterized membrane protein